MKTKTHMTIDEAKQVIKKAMEQSEIAIKEVKAAKRDIKKAGMFGEYYTVLDNCVKELESCHVAIQAFDELKELKEQQQQIVEILRTHRFSDEECIKQIMNLVGISAKRKESASATPLLDGCYIKDGDSLHEDGGFGVSENAVRVAVIDDFVARAWRELGADDRDVYARESIIEIADQMKLELADKEVDHERDI